MKWFRVWFYVLTGGRPMMKLAYTFTDMVSGELVYHYKDKLGRVWLATSSWALFRVAWTGISCESTQEVSDG